MRGYENTLHMSQVTVTPLNYAQFEKKNDTGTSLWTNNLDDNMLKMLPDHFDHRAASKSFSSTRFRGKRAVIFSPIKSNNLYADFGKK